MEDRMNIALWVIQLLLAITFLASGVNKLARPRLALAGQLPYVEDFSDAQIKGIGALELLSVIGLVVPPVLHIATFLTPLAAVGLVLLMGGAIVTHLRRSEPQMAAVNVVLLVLAAVVAVGRFGPYSF
jgi:uncharacterized membrane protein YphA (DoxX/SURF4 family)